MLVAAARLANPPTHVAQESRIAPPHSAVPPPPLPFPANGAWHHLCCDSGHRHCACASAPDSSPTRKYPAPLAANYLQCADPPVHLRAKDQTRSHPHPISAVQGAADADDPISHCAQIQRQSSNRASPAPPPAPAHVIEQDPLEVYQPHAVHPS